MQGVDHILLNHALLPRHQRRMQNPSGQATMKERATRTKIRVYLRVQDERVVEATFLSRGHLPVTGCLSFLLMGLHGVPLQVAISTHPAALACALRLPPEEEWCAEMAVDCLHAAVDDCVRRGAWRPQDAGEAA